MTGEMCYTRINQVPYLPPRSEKGMATHEIRVSRSDPNVYLFYKSERARRWVCAVTRRLEDEGFSISTYPTDVVNEGTKIWPK
jgi:hypothetical protein